MPLNKETKSNQPKSLCGFVSNQGQHNMESAQYLG